MFFRLILDNANGDLICYTDRAVDKHPKIWYNRNNQTRRVRVTPFLDSSRWMYS